MNYAGLRQALRLSDKFCAVESQKPMRDAQFLLIPCQFKAEAGFVKSRKPVSPSKCRQQYLAVVEEEPNLVGEP